MKLLYLGLFISTTCVITFNRKSQEEIKYDYKIDLDGDSIHIQDKFGKNTTVHADKLLYHIAKDNL